MNREDRFYDLMEENTDDASIQYEIGLCYLNGDGTEKDTAEAEKWLQIRDTSRRKRCSKAAIMARRRNLRRPTSSNCA